MRPKTLCVALVVFACAAVTIRPAYGQSLGELGRQEEQRREKNKTPSKEYTNKDLATPPQVFSNDPANPTPARAAGTTPAPAPGAADKAKEAPKDSEPAKDQKYWAEKKKALDNKLEQDKVLADAMQSRINGLAADFAARSDPAQRAGIERDRQRAIAELDRLNKSIKDDQTAITDFAEEARKASVPPGWLR